MLKHAFKEWAVICRASAEGKQALILRKGGIAENGGDFQVEHTRFWLFPAYVHQQKEGVSPEALPLLEQAEAERPPPGKVRLSHFAAVTGIYHMHDLIPALLLAHLLYGRKKPCANVVPTAHPACSCYRCASIAPPRYMSSRTLPRTRVAEAG